MVETSKLCTLQAWLNLQNFQFLLCRLRFWSNLAAVFSFLSNVLHKSFQQTFPAMKLTEWGLQVPLRPLRGWGAKRHIRLLLCVNPSKQLHERHVYPGRCIGQWEKGQVDLHYLWSITKAENYKPKWDSFQCFSTNSLCVCKFLLSFLYFLTYFIDFWEAA